DVATQTAAEAVPRLAPGRDDERGCLLAVEGAEALVRGARLPEVDRFADHLEHRQLVLHFGCDTDRQMAPPGSLDRTPVDRPALRRHRAQVPNMAVGLSSLDKPGCEYSAPPNGGLSTLLSILSGSISPGLPSRADDSGQQREPILRADPSLAER